MRHAEAIPGGAAGAAAGADRQGGERVREGVRKNGAPMRGKGPQNAPDKECRNDCHSWAWLAMLVSAWARERLHGFTRFHAVFTPSPLRKSSTTVTLQSHGDDAGQRSKPKAVIRQRCTPSPFPLAEKKRAKRN